MNLTIFHDNPVRRIAATALVLLLSLIVELIGGDVSTDPHSRTVDPPVMPLVSRWTTPVGLEFVLIPPSTFTVPDPARKGERLTVETSAFYCARHVVTKGLFARFMKEIGRKPTRNIERSNRTEFGDPDTLALDLIFESEEQWLSLSPIYANSPTSAHILNFTTFNEGETFAAWLSRQAGREFTLPTEAQAEAIIRGGVAHGDEGFWWMATEPSGIDCWLSEHSAMHTSPALAHVPGMYVMTPQGFFSEFEDFWTKDYFQRPYAPERRLDPQGPGPNPRGLRVQRCIMRESRSATPSDQAQSSILVISAIIPADYRAADPEVLPLAEPLPVIALPRQTLTLPGGVTLPMLQISAGNFIMGRSRKDRPWTEEWPETTMVMQAYALGETEVTQAQFRAMTGINPSRVHGDHLPAHSLTMGEIQAFCELLTTQERQAGRLDAAEEYRLPTEAEWERAARAGTSTRWSCGDDPVLLKRYAWFDVIGQDGPKPVATRWPNRWGFYDMEGNVLERCGEHQLLYPGGEVRNQWLSLITGSSAWTDYYSARGGSFNMGAIGCEPTMRRSLSTESRVSHVGFRLCRGPIYPYFSPSERLKFGPQPWMPFFHDDIRSKPSYRAVMEAKGVILPPLPKLP